MRPERLGTALVMIGFALVAAAAIGLALLPVAGGGSGAVVVVVGPIPVAVGWGSQGPLLVAVAAVMALIMIVELFLLAWYARRVNLDAV